MVWVVGAECRHEHRRVEKIFHLLSPALWWAHCSRILRRVSAVWSESMGLPVLKTQTPCLMAHASSIVALARLEDDGYWRFERIRTQVQAPVA